MLVVKHTNTLTDHTIIWIFMRFVCLLSPLAFKGRSPLRFVGRTILHYQLDRWESVSEPHWQWASNYGCKMWCVQVWFPDFNFGRVHFATIGRKSIPKDQLSVAQRKRRSMCVNAQTLNFFLGGFSWLTPTHAQAARLLPSYRQRHNSLMHVKRFVKTACLHLVLKHLCQLNFFSRMKL